MHAPLLLTQHLLAVAVRFLLRCSLRRGSGHSTAPFTVNFKPTFRYFKDYMSKPKIFHKRIFGDILDTAQTKQGQGDTCFVGKECSHFAKTFRPTCRDGK